MGSRVGVGRPAPCHTRKDCLYDCDPRHPLRRLLGEGGEESAGGEVVAQRARVHPVRLEQQWPESGF